MIIDVLGTLIAENQEMLSQYHHWRKKEPLDEAQKKRVKSLIEDFWLYRSHKPLTVYTAYGVHETPIVYMDEQSIDVYVLELLDDNKGYEEFDNFEYCVEKSTMTGREIGDLLAHW